VDGRNSTLPVCRRNLIREKRFKSDERNWLHEFRQPPEQLALTSVLSSPIERERAIQRPCDHLRQTQPAESRLESTVRADPPDNKWPRFPAVFCTVEMRLNPSPEIALAR
jgi:hypothetical protein